MIFNPTRYRNVAKFTKEIFPIPTQTTPIHYDGYEFNATWVLKNYNSNYMTISGQTSGTNAGQYTAIISLIDPENTVWADYTSDDKQVIWTIQRDFITSVPIAISGVTYTGNVIDVTQALDYTNSAMFSLSGTTSAINAGDYTVIITPTSNYQWSDGTTTAKQVIWTIGKADPNLTLSQYELNFTPSNKTITITAFYDGNGVLSTAPVSGWTNAYEYAYTNISGKTITISSTQKNGTTALSILTSETQNYEAGRYDIQISASGFSDSGGEETPSGPIYVTPNTVTLTHFLEDEYVDVENPGNGEITVSEYDSSVLELNIVQQANYIQVVSLIADGTITEPITKEFYVNVAASNGYPSASLKVTVTLDYTGTGEEENPENPDEWYFAIDPPFLDTHQALPSTVYLGYPGNGSISVSKILPKEYENYVSYEIYQQQKKITFTQNVNADANFDVYIEISADGNYQGETKILPINTHRG